MAIIMITQQGPHNKITALHHLFIKQRTRNITAALAVAGPHENMLPDDIIASSFTHGTFKGISAINPFSGFDFRRTGLGALIQTHSREL